MNRFARGEWMREKGEATTARSYVYKGSKGRRNVTPLDEEVHFAVLGLRSPWDVPFELVGEVASARTMAEAGDVEGGAATRHFSSSNLLF